MSFRTPLCATVLALASLTSSAAAKGLLVQQRGSLRSSVDTKAFQTDLHNAMGEAMGCGGQVGEERLAKIREALAPVWLALPKKSPGRVERRSLRYLVHRYFHQQSALLVRGFEPSRPSNASGWGSEDILSQRVPSYVEAVLESKHAQERGFDLQDAVLMVATVEQLIYDSESMLLEQVYKSQRKPVERSLTAKGLGQVLEVYLIHWLLGDDPEGIRIVMNNRELMREAVPNWDGIVSMAQGRIKALEFQRQRAPAATARPGHNALSQLFSFEDAHEVVGGITKSFASYWRSECAAMKASLEQMDVQKTGRVPLSRFYSRALDAEWRFGESETYLRDLGALDETSLWYGKQVVIPNYVQAASNCVVSTAHYMVCCTNECDGLLGEIERGVRGPEATSEAVLAMVGNMTSQATIDHDDPPQLGRSMKAQLEQIATSHGGMVPLHGRLFAQWLHYVFPRECPFPHKAGTIATVTPTQYGSTYMATPHEMREHAQTINATDAMVGMDKEELQWMSQWSSEEELILGYSQGRYAAWRAPILAGTFALLLVAGVTNVGMTRRSMISALPMHAKSHFV